MYMAGRVNNSNLELIKRDVEKELENIENEFSELQDFVPMGYTTSEPDNIKPFQNVLIHKNYNWTGVTMTKKAAIMIYCVEPVPPHIINSSSISVKGNWAIISEFDY